MPPPKKPTEEELRLWAVARQLELSKGLAAPEDKTLKPPTGATLNRDPLWSRFKAWLRRLFR